MEKITIELNEIQADILTRLLLEHRRGLSKTIANVDNYHIPDIDPIILKQKKILKSLWKSQLSETTVLIKRLKGGNRKC